MGIDENGLIFFFLINILFLATTPLSLQQNQRLLASISTEQQNAHASQWGMDEAIALQYGNLSKTNCYDETGRAQHCTPYFINVAFQKPVEATNTCGLRKSTPFCMIKEPGNVQVLSQQLTFRSRSSELCDHCDARTANRSHPASFLTDFNDPRRETWWQSETMADNMQYPNTVNLTLKLGKSYHITYVRLKFVSPRPESFVIYKKRFSTDDQWIPWQYYSGSCRGTFRMPEKAPILPGHENVAQCTREFSDISPLTGGNVVFSVLDERPSATAYEESEVLQDWTTASEIRISFVRMNTFGDERFFGKQGNNLLFYWYGVSDLAVGGRCICHGHANQCLKSTGLNGERVELCDCQHNTAGEDCQKCADFYNDRPWQPATSTEANECKICNCNNLSKRCRFDQKLFEETGSGGFCLGCTGNTEGAHCEKCLPGFWRRPGENHCTACDCDKVGSVSTQCGNDGMCHCLPGVAGKQCDRCAPGWYGLTRGVGCKDCKCDPRGSTGHCSEIAGSSGDFKCHCKKNVEGKRCEQCKPGYFQLSQRNSYGCTPCFCFLHSSICFPANEYLTGSKYVAYNISSEFTEDSDGWTAHSDYRSEVVQQALGGEENMAAIGVSQHDDFSVYFHAPKKFLGDQRFSYGQDIHFWFWTLPGKSVRAGPRDLVLVGKNCRETLSLSFGAQANPHPSSKVTHYRFKIHNDSALQWSPHHLRETDFISILSNLTSIKLRGTFTRGDVGFLAGFSMGSARKGEEYGIEADWVEYCRCPEGYEGQFCEKCSAGFRREVPFGGPYSRCVPCSCNDHGTRCDAESGSCFCEHNTEGAQCERCAKGWYGNALRGTSQDCKKCDCPEGSTCLQLGDGDTICTECPDGYSGRKCEYCAADWFGDPANSVPCQRCQCSNNTDENAIGNCDQRTGECLKCIHNTAGRHCEKCAIGFWGDALVKGDCKPCNCFSPGTMLAGRDDLPWSSCDQATGQCHCQPNVIGLRCDSCREGFFNITSGLGCIPCDCDPKGSNGAGCDSATGQCQCKKGVIGAKCDQCAPHHYGFNSDNSGCKECNCDPVGTEDDEPCDIHNGQCLCMDNVEGRQCDSCIRNYYGLRTQGYCEPCDDCYKLIERRYENISSALEANKERLKDLSYFPKGTVLHNGEGEDSFELRLKINELRRRVELELSRTLEKNKVQELESIRINLSQSKNELWALTNRMDGFSMQMANINQKLATFQNEKKRMESQLKRDEENMKQQIKDLKKFSVNGVKTSNMLLELSAKATDLVRSQEFAKNQLVQMTTEITNITSRALEAAEEAIRGNGSSPEIVKLLDDITSMRSSLKNELVAAKEVAKEADETLNEAALLKSKTENVKMPENNMDSVLSEVETLNSEILQHEKRIEELMEQGKILGSDFESLLKEINKTILPTKLRIQEDIGIVEKLILKRNQSKKAVDMVKEVVKEAKTMAKELSEFEQNRRMNYEEFSGVVEDIPLIRDRLSSFNSRLGKNRRIVNRFNKKALQTLNVSIETKERTMFYSVSMDELLEDIRKTTDELGTAKKTQEECQDELDGTEQDLAIHKEVLEKDQRKVEEALRKSVAAEKLAKTLDRTLSGQLETMNAIDSRISELPADDNVSDEDLLELERNLERLEAEFAEIEAEKAQSEEKIQQLSQEGNKLRGQVDLLEKELGNFRNIRGSLPTNCFNKPHLEQEK